MLQSLVSTLVVLGLSCASGRAAFEKVTVDIDGTAFGSFSRVLRVDPLTLWISDFFEGSFETFIVVESDGGYSFAFDSRTGFPAGTESSFQGDPVVRGEHLFYVTAVSEAGNGGDNRAEGVVAQYRDGVLTEYGPRARALLGSGTETAPFYYRMGDANAQGVVGLLGYDNNFAHFVIRVDASGGQIVAQESVTDFPGTPGPFTRFAADIDVSPDGTLMAFRGEDANAGAEGLFLWNGSVLEPVIDGASEIPGASGIQFGGLMFSNVESYFLPDNSLVLVDIQGYMARYKDGVLSRILGVGDVVGGETIGSVQVTQAPQGNLLITDTSTGMVYLFDGVEVRPFFTIGEDVGEGFQAGSRLFPNPDGFYFYAQRFDRELLRVDVRLYRRSWDGETLEPLLELDRETFGQNPTPFAVIVEGDTALLSMSEGLFRGTRADLDGGNPEPEGSFSVYSSSLPDGVAGPAQDADGDGLANLLEYVLGLDALVADQGVRPLSLELVSGIALGLDNDPRDYALVAFRVLREIADVQLTIRAASVLADLPSGADNVMPIGSPQPDGLYDIHSYRTIFPIDEVSQVFVDLLLELE